MRYRIVTEEWSGMDRFVVQDKFGWPFGWLAPWMYVSSFTTREKAERYIAEVTANE